MNLIGNLDGAEGRLSGFVLGRSPCDGVVYGGGPAVLFRDAEQLLRAHEAGTLRGVAGLTITEGAISRLPGPLREAWGRLLNLAPKVYVSDRWSFEQAPHLQLTPLLGTSLAWGATEAEASRETDAAIVRWPQHALSVGEAIAMALLDIPCLLLCSNEWGSQHNRVYHPLVRWAVEAGVEQNVCWSPQEMEGKDPVHVARKYVEARRAQVADIIADLATKRDPLAVLTTATARGDSSTAWGGQTLELGAPFDEELHYTGDYYGGEGSGIRYTLPDGTGATYRSTAHDWSGFARVARWLRDLGMPGSKLLDLGCGAGGFVRHAVSVGFDAYGVDISKAAIEKGVADGLAARLFLGDISKDLPDLRDLDVVTAWDLWEHVYESDIDALIDTAASRMRQGGIGAFVICTRGEGEKDWSFARGTIATAENSWLLVSGHVTIRTWGWWAGRFEARGFRVRYDLCHRFQVLRSEEPTMRGCDSWSPRNTLFVERA